jgi:hypothetical protein
MPVQTTILDIVEVLLPVVSTCSHQTGNINIIFIPIADENCFIANWGSGSEDEDVDSCIECETLGELGDALPFFFIPAICKPNSDDDREIVVVLKMDVSVIETLTNLVNNYAEEKLSPKELRVYPAHEEMCNKLADNFHVFVQQGNDGDFFDDDWTFDKPRFVERNKAVVVGYNGVHLSADISTVGDNEQEICSVETIWLSKNDLAALNSWLTNRTEPSQR